MKTRLLRWVPIVLFFLVATLSVALHLTRAVPEPCRPTPRNLSPSKTTAAVSTDHVSRRGQEIDTRGEQPKGEKYVKKENVDPAFDCFASSDGVWSVLWT